MHALGALASLASSAKALQPQTKMKAVRLLSPLLGSL